MVARFGAATARTAAREIDRRRAVHDCARTDQPRSNAVVGCAESQNCRLEFKSVKPRYRLRTLLNVVTIVGAFFGGRAFFLNRHVSWPLSLSLGRLGA